MILLLGGDASVLIVKQLHFNLKRAGCAQAYCDLGIRQGQ